MFGVLSAPGNPLLNLLWPIFQYCEVFCLAEQEAELSSHQRSLGLVLCGAVWILGWAEKCLLKTTPIGRRCSAGRDQLGDHRAWRDRFPAGT